MIPDHIRRLANAITTSDHPAIDRACVRHLRIMADDYDSDGETVRTLLDIVERLLDIRVP